ELCFDPSQPCFDGTERIVSGQLTEQESHELGPAREPSDLFIALVLFNDFLKLVSRNPLQKLGQYITSVGTKPVLLFLVCLCLAHGSLSGVVRRAGSFLLTKKEFRGWSDCKSNPCSKIQSETNPSEAGQISVSCYSS